MAAQLTTIERVKGAARIPAAVTMWNARIGEIIEEVEGELLKFTQLSAFPATTYSGYLPTVTGSPLVLLPKWTVFSVVALTQLAGPGPGSALVDGTDYAWDESGVVRLLSGTFSGRVHATWTAGMFQTAGQTDMASIRLATLMAARQWHQEPLAGLEAQTVSPVSKRVAKPTWDDDAIYNEIRGMLARWQRT